MDQKLGSVEPFLALVVAACPARTESRKQPAVASDCQGSFCGPLQRMFPGESSAAG